MKTKIYKGHVVQHGRADVQWVRKRSFTVWSVYRHATSAHLPKQITIAVKMNKSRFYPCTKVFEVSERSQRTFYGNDCFLRYNDALAFLKDAWKDRAIHEKRSHATFLTECRKILRVKRSTKRESLTLAADPTLKTTGTHP